MDKHINFLGYSLWISDSVGQDSKEVTQAQPLYSPSVLAAYSMIFNPFVGILLYGLNVYRRGQCWRGRLLIVLSGLLIVLRMLNPTSEGFTLGRVYFLANALVAVSLYQIEKPHFNRAIRGGSRQARWWPPLLWIIAPTVVLLLLQK